MSAQNAEYRRIKEKVEVLAGDRGATGERAVRYKDLDGAIGESGALRRVIDGIRWEASAEQGRQVGQFAAKIAWDFSLGLEEWTAVDSSISHAEPIGALVTATTGANAHLLSPVFPVLKGGQNPVVQMRIRRRPGTGTAEWDGRVFYQTEGHVIGSGYVGRLSKPDAAAGEWGIVFADMSKLEAGGTDWLNSNITRLRIDIAKSGSDIWEIDWIAIGNIGVGVSANAMMEITARIDQNGDDYTSVAARTTKLEAEGRSVFAAHTIWQFTDGITGWQVSGGGSIAHSVGDGVMDIQKNQALVYAWRPDLAIPTAQVPLLKIRYRRVSGATATGISRLRFKTTGATDEWQNSVDLPAAVDTQWIDAVVSMKDHPRWSGTCQLIMLVPSDGVGSPAQFVVDYIALGAMSAAVGGSVFERLSTEVRATDGRVTVISTALTQLEAKIEDPQTGLRVALANARSELSARVEEVEGGLDAVSERVTDLEVKIDDPDTGLVKALATAKDDLNARVNQTNGNVSAVSERLTTLEAKGDRLFVAERGWGFSTGLEGWVGLSSTVWHDINGYANFSKTAATAGIFVAGLSIQTSRVPRLKIRYRRASGTASAQCRIRWRTSTRPDEWSQHRLLPAATNAEWIEAEIDMSADAAWTGDLTMLMFVASEGNGTTGQWVVDYILLGADGLAASASSVSQAEARVTEIDGKVTAQASRTDTLRVDVDGQGGSIGALQNIVSGPGGLTAKYEIVLDLGQGVQGGFVVTGARKLDGTGYIETRFRGDMVVDDSLTANKLIANDIIVRNSIQLAGGTVLTGTIGNNAVSSLIGWSQIKYIDEISSAIEFNVRPGAKVLIFGRFTATDVAGDTQRPIANMPNPGDLRVLMNGVVQSDFNANMMISANTTAYNLSSIKGDLFAVIDPLSSAGNTWRYFNLSCGGYVLNTSNKPIGRYTFAVLELAR